VSNDEFDIPNSAPLPPTDRDWRHPAEKAAVQRAELQLAATPPPLSRRSTIVVAISSLLASVAVLAVAVPKGMSEYTEEAPTATATPQRVKNFAVSALTTVSSRKGTTSALTLGSGLIAVATDYVDLIHGIWISTPDGSTEKLSVCFVDHDVGLALLNRGVSSSTELSSLDLLTSDKRAKLEALDSMQIQNADGHHVLSAEIGISTNNSPLKALPITTSQTLSGIALATSGENKIIGIALRHSHSSWLLPIELFQSVIQHCLRSMSSNMPTPP